MKQKVGNESRSDMSDSVTPRTIAHQESSVHGIPQARIWIELPFPSPGYLPDPGIEPGSPALQADSLLSEPPGKSYPNRQASQSQRESKVKLLTGRLIPKSSS